jgi:hypothetical protein
MIECQMFGTLDGGGCKIQSGLATYGDLISDTSVACDSCENWYCFFYNTRIMNNVILYYTLLYIAYLVSFAQGDACLPMDASCMLIYL